MSNRHEFRFKLNVHARLLLAFLALSAVTLTFAALLATRFVTLQYLQHLLLSRVNPEHMQGPLGPAMQRLMDQLNGPERVLLTRIHYGILRAGALALAVSVLLSYLLSRRITRPIAAMHKAAMRMARGDFSQRVAAAGDDELGDLSRALNTLARNLKEADQLRKNMVADLAHELRTPLTGLRSYVEAVKDGILPASEHNLDTILAETLRLERLVEELRELSLLDANALPLQTQPVDVAAIIVQTTALRQSELAARDIRLEVDLPAGLPRAQADPDRLAQIIQNLLANAITHTPAGGTIRVSAVRREPGASPDVSGYGAGRDARPTILVTVADSGPGIPPGDLPYVFERFYRADPSRDRATGGTGLGLTITRKLVEAHGGTIRAESRPGEGAVFTFTLPVAP